MSTRRERLAAARRRRVHPRSLLRNGAELVALTAVAVAQPVLDVFGRAPEIFIEAGAGRGELWAFAIIVALVPPLVLIAVELVVGLALGERVRAVVHIALVAGLALLIAVRALRLGFDWVGTPLLLAAIVVAIGFTALRVRSSMLQQWLVFAACAPVLYVVVFLFGAPTRSLAGTGNEESKTTVSVAPTETPRPPIVMLVLDELPVRSLLDADGTIDADRFPGFAAFADDSTWFRNATAAASHTAKAVPVLLTGQHAHDKDVAPVAAEYPNTIFRLLGGAYRLNVSELDTQLCAVPRCNPANPENAPVVTTTSVAADTETEPEPADDPSPLAEVLRRARVEFPDMVALHDIGSTPSVAAEEFTETTAPPTTTTTAPTALTLDESITATTVDRGLAKLPVVQPDRFSKWTDRIDADTEHPALSVLHITMPHNPWYLDSTGTRYAYPDNFGHLAGGSEGRWSTDPGAAISARQRHLLHLRYVDTLVASLQQRLEELGIWDEATVIVTADHGAGFTAGGSFRVWADDTEVELIGIPLLVHGPDFDAGRIDDTPAQSVDVARTISAIARIDAPWPLDGEDLRDLPVRPRTTYPFGATPETGRYSVIELDVTGHLEALLAAAAADGGSLGSGDDLSILQAGPSGELVGTQLSDHEVLDEPAGEVSLQWPATTDWAPDESGIVPAFIIGDLDADDSALDGAGRTIVVSVDGRIGTTALTYATRDRTAQFSPVLPAPWLQGGPHDVRFFLRLDDGRLAPLERTD